MISCGSEIQIQRQILLLPCFYLFILEQIWHFANGWDVGAPQIRFRPQLLHFPAVGASPRFTLLVRLKTGGRLR